MSALNINKLREFSSVFDEEFFSLFDFKKSVDGKNVDGGTSHRKVKNKMEECILELVLLKRKVEELSSRLVGS
jgi:argininosuccinate lyase